MIRTMKLRSPKLSLTAIAAVSLLAVIAAIAAETMTMPEPWSTVAKPAYGPWRVVAIFPPSDTRARTKESAAALRKKRQAKDYDPKKDRDLQAFAEKVAKSLSEPAKREVKPRYSDADSTGKTLTLHYELEPQKQISVAAARYNTTQEASTEYDERIEDKIRPEDAGEQRLVYRIVNKGEHKDAAGAVIGRWTVLESANEGQFDEKAYWTQGEYLFEAEPTMRDFRSMEYDQRAKYHKGLLENFLSAALKR